MKPVTTFLYLAMALGLAVTALADINLVRYIAVSVVTVCVIFLLKSRNSNTSDRFDIEHNSVNISVVNNELNELFDLLESAIKEDLVVVKQELLQIKGLVNNAVSDLTDSFYSLSSTSDEQYRLISDLVNIMKNTGNDRALIEIDENNKKIKDSSADAVRSLQFEDIVIQVSDNSLQYIDNLDKFLNEFRQRISSRINSSANAQDAVVQLKSYVNDVKQIRQDIQLPDRKAVHQNNLSEGGIELF